MVVPLFDRCTPPAHLRNWILFILLDSLSQPVLIPQIHHIHQPLPSLCHPPVFNRPRGPARRTIPSDSEALAFFWSGRASADISHRVLRFRLPLRKQMQCPLEGLSRRDSSSIALLAGHPSGVKNRGVASPFLEVSQETPSRAGEV